MVCVQSSQYVTIAKYINNIVKDQVPVVSAAAASIEDIDYHKQRLVLFRW